jgi:hypothetical protein
MIADRPHRRTRACTSPVTVFRSFEMIPATSLPRSSRQPSRRSDFGEQVDARVVAGRHHRHARRPCGFGIRAIDGPSGLRRGAVATEAGDPDAQRIDDEAVLGTEGLGHAFERFELNLFFAPAGPTDQVLVRRNFDVVVPGHATVDVRSVQETELAESLDGPIDRGDVYVDVAGVQASSDVTSRDVAGDVHDRAHDLAPTEGESNTLIA